MAQPDSWQRYLPLAVHGTFGTPLLIMPTSGDNLDDYIEHNMLEALSGHINSGLVKSCSASTAYQQHIVVLTSLSHAEKGRRHVLFDRYLVEEVVPFIYGHCHRHMSPSPQWAPVSAPITLSMSCSDTQTSSKWCICIERPV